jgi:hypothetical protein
MTPDKTRRSGDQYFHSPFLQLRMVTLIPQPILLEVKITLPGESPPCYK